MAKFKPNEYAAALYELLQKTPVPQQKRIISWFAGYLVRQNALPLISKIVREFSEICDHADGAIPVEITTRDGKFQAAELEKALGKKVRITARKDPTVRGGLKIKIGDTLIDNTLSRRMNNLRQSLGR